MRSVYKGTGPFYPTKGWQYRLRRNLVWAAFVSWIWAPVYQMLWEYGLNFRGKWLYVMSPYRRFHDRDLDRHSAKIVADSQAFASFAHRLREKIPQQIIDRERAKMLARKDEFAFVSGLFQYLDEDTRLEILKFALSPDVLRYVIGYLKVAPRLQEPAIMFSVARTDLPEEGSKLWHRDSFHYKSMKLMIALSDIDDTAGPNYVVGHDQAPYCAEIPKPVIPGGISEWARLRLSDGEMAAYVDLGQTYKLAGGVGTTSVQDACRCYHKGGYCTGKDRLILQLDYVTDDGTGQPPPAASWVDTKRPSLKPLLANGLNRFIVGEAGVRMRGFLRRARVYGALRALYYRRMFYFRSPRREAR